MGHQIIKQPDGKFAVWSTITDGLFLHGATRAEVEEWFVNEAKRDALDRVQRVLDCVEADRPGDVYFQFAIPWKDAVRLHNKNFPDDAIEDPAVVRPTPRPHDDNRPAAGDTNDTKGA